MANPQLSKTNFNSQISQAPKLLRTFGIIKDIVVKEKIFEYSLDKRLS